MIRLTLLTCFFLSLGAVCCAAEEHPRFAITSEATRTGDKISLSIKIVENSMQVVPNSGPTNVTTVRASPRLMLFQGKQAQIAVGRSRSAHAGANPANEPTELDSGIKVDVISVKDQDNVLIVTTVIEHGSVVWAEAATVKVKTKSS